MTGDAPARLVSAGATHVGHVRRENQDAFLDRPDLGLWVVADGMGGHEDGALASRLVVEGLDAITTADSPRALLGVVKARIAAVNARLIATAAARGGGVTIASTVVVLLAHGGHFACAWAGDSRLYLLRDGVLAQVSHDHSQVQELVDAGQITPADAAHHPAANVVTRAVGVDATLEIDVCQDRLRPGDTFLLCSDGVTKMMDEAEIRVLIAGRPAAEAVEALIGQSLERGGIDNVTAVVVRDEAAPEPAGK